MKWLFGVSSVIVAILIVPVTVSIQAAADSCSERQQVCFAFCQKSESNMSQARPHAGGILPNACQRDAGRVEFRQRDVGLIGDSPAARAGCDARARTPPGRRVPSDTGEVCRRQRWPPSLTAGRLCDTALADAHQPI